MISAPQAALTSHGLANSHSPSEPVLVMVREVPECPFSLGLHKKYCIVSNAMLKSKVSNLK